MAKPSPVSSASEDALVAADLRAAVAGSTLVSVPSVLLGGAIFLALLYPVTPTARLFGWYGLFVALEVVSGTDTWLTRRRHGGEVGRAWYLRHVAMAAATGTLWGVIPMLPDHGVAEATDWAMVLAGLSVVAAGGMVSSAPKVSMWIAFAVPMFTLSSFAIARWYPADNRVLMAVGLLRQLPLQLEPDQDLSLQLIPSPSPRDGLLVRAAADGTCANGASEASAGHRP